MLFGAEREQMSAQRRLAREIEAVLRRICQSLGQGGRADLRHRQMRPRRGRVQDQLAGNAERVGEDRAQALVPLHDIPERRLQRCAVERAGEPHGKRDRIGRAVMTFILAVQPVEEPQPALRKGERDLGRTCHRTQGRAGDLGIRVETLDQRLHGRRLEQAADRNLDIERGPDAADQPRGEQ